MFSPRHGQGVVNDVCRRQPRLNVWITCSGAKCRKAVAEEYLWRILVAGHAGNLGQLISKITVDPATIELVILKTKGQVIHQLGTEGMIPVDSPQRGPFEGCATITDRRWKRRERSSRQVLVIKHL